MISPMTEKKTLKIIFLKIFIHTYLYSFFKKRKLLCIKATRCRLSCYASSSITEKEMIRNTLAKLDEKYFKS